MKIVHITIYPPKGEKHSCAGGVASYSKNLVTSISYQEGDKVFVLCDKINNQKDRYREDNIEVVRCFDKTPLYFIQLLKEISRIKPDVVHIQQELSLFGSVNTAYLLQWLVFLIRKYDTIITLHGVVSFKKVNADFVKQNNSRLPDWLVRLAFKIVYSPICYWSKKIIVHEECFKDILIDEYKVKPEKISVINHGVEDFKTISKEEACSKLNLDPNRNSVLFMGYLTGYKGIDLLIDGFGEYAKKNPEAFLVIGAGKHPKLKNNERYLAEYARLVKKAGDLIPAHQYRWTGFIDESAITDYFSASDVSVYPYTIQMSSSGPMAIAIGYGKPFLASNVFQDVVSDALLFECNAQALSEKFQEFFENKIVFFDKIKTMKALRMWNSVALKMGEIYKK